MSHVLTAWSKAICCIDRVPSQVSMSEDQNGSVMQYWTGDCSDEVVLTAYAEESIQACGKPEVIVIAAGAVKSASLEDTLVSEMDALYHDNLRLVALCLKTFYRYCKSESTIPKTAIIVSSNAGCVARPDQAMYAAMKAGVISLARSVAVKWGPSNIRVNVIAPGTVIVSRNEASVRSRLTSAPLDPTRPLGRIAVPEDLDQALSLFLNPGILITGHVLIVDSGSSLSGRLF